MRGHLAVADPVTLALGAAAVLLSAWLLAVGALRVAVRHHAAARQLVRRLPGWLVRPVLGAGVLAAGLGTPSGLAGAEPVPAAEPSPPPASEPPVADPGPIGPSARMVPLAPGEDVPLPPDAVPDRVGPDPAGSRRPTPGPVRPDPDPAPTGAARGDEGRPATTATTVHGDRRAVAPQGPATPRTPATGSPDDLAGPAVVWMVALDDEAASLAGEGERGEPGNEAPDAGGSTAVETETWPVELGDHLWAVATEVLADAGRPTDDRAVLGYWTALVDANRDRLVDPDNPDLILPGQVLVLPPVNGG